MVYKRQLFFQYSRPSGCDTSKLLSDDLKNELYYRSYIPTEKEAALRPVTPAQQAAADLARIKTEKLPIPAGVQTALAEHYQALLHTNDFYQYLTLFKELGQKQTQQQSRGRKINAMDAYFYQMVERVLREELAVAFGESQQEAGRRLLEILR